MPSLMPGPAVAENPEGAKEIPVGNLSQDEHDELQDFLLPDAPASEGPAAKGKEKDEVPKVSAAAKDKIVQPSLFDFPDELIQDSKPVERPVDQPPTPGVSPGTPPADTLPDVSDLKLSSKAARAFATMRERIAQISKENSDLKASQATMQTSSKPEVADARLPELEGKLTAAYDKLGELSLAADPRFQAKYDGPKEQIVNQVKTLFKEFEVDEKLAEQLPSMTRKQRNEFLKENVPDLVSTIMPMMVGYDSIESQKSEALKNHKVLADAFAAERADKQNLLSKKGRETLMQGAVAATMKSGALILRPVEGNEKFNEVVKAVGGRVNYLFASDDAQAQAESMVLGAAAPVYLMMFKQERDKRIALEAQIKSRTAARPSLDSKFRVGSPKKDEVPEEMTASEAAERALNL